MTVTSNLPAPPIPPDCDLRDFQYYPMDITRLFGSEFHAQATDAEWRAGITLWLKSYHQVPAGSLPQDDVSLARLAEFGRNVKAWMKVKGRALWGWSPASDGRLYHKTVAEKVHDAIKRKELFRERSKKANAKRWAGLDHGHEHQGGETTEKVERFLPGADDSEVRKGGKSLGKSEAGFAEGAMAEASNKDPTRIQQGSNKDPTRIQEGSLIVAGKGKEGKGTEEKRREEITPPASGGIGLSLPHTGPLAKPEDPAATAAKILESGNKKIQGCDQDAVKKALAEGDLLALVRAYGGNDTRGHEWARDAAGRKLGRIAIVLDWAQRSRRPVREPSGLRAALADWDRLLSAEQVEISREWAEGLGIRSKKDDSLPQEARSTPDPAQDRGEDDLAPESQETGKGDMSTKTPQPHESAKEITQ